MQRIVRTLQLKDDPVLIERYKEVHAEVWPEVKAGIKEVGVDVMDIYLHGNTAVMILEVPDGLDVQQAFERLATLPRQQEWEEYVSGFQQCHPGDSSADKWHDMNRIFSL